MKKSLIGLASLSSALAMSVGLGAVAQSGAPQLSERSYASQQQGDRGQQIPGDTKTARLDAWRRRGTKAPTGKRNSWSVKQGQRRATKHRNQSRHRQALRG